MTTEERQNERQENEALKSAKETAKRETKKQVKKIIWNAIKKAIIAFFAAFGKYILIALAIIAVITFFSSLFDGDGSGSNSEGYNQTNMVSISSTDITKEEFIEAAQAYNGGEDYHTYLSAYAEEFYDICTDYEINPCFAYAHACIETGYRFK